MRPSILFCGVSIFLFVISQLTAETLHVPDVGVSLTAPAGWKHDDEEGRFGYRVVPPTEQQNHNKIREIRIHFPDVKGGTSFAEQLEYAITKASEVGPKWGNSNDRKRYLSSSDVITKSGMKGLKGSFGEKQEDGSIRYTINKYYFKNGSGKILCVCAYVFGRAELALQYEEIILSGLKISDG